MSSTKKQSIKNEDDVIEFIECLLQQEGHYYDPEQLDWLRTDTEHTDAEKFRIDSNSRQAMIKWFYLVIDTLQFNSSTAEIAVSYLDRYMMSQTRSMKKQRHHQFTGLRQDSSLFQLMSMTCLYVAIKLHEPYALELNSMVELSNGAFTENHFERMEYHMLQALNWRMNPPTTKAYVHAYVDIILYQNEVLEKDDILEMTLSQTEYCVRETDLFLTQKPSLIAYWSLMNTLERCSLTTRTTLNDSLRTIRSLLIKTSRGGYLTDPSVSQIRDQLSSILQKRDRPNGLRSTITKTANTYDINMQQENTDAEKSPRRVSIVI